MTRLPALAVGCSLCCRRCPGASGISAVKHALGYLPLSAHLLLVQLVFSALVIAVLASYRAIAGPSAMADTAGGVDRRAGIRPGGPWRRHDRSLTRRPPANTSLISTTGVVLRAAAGVVDPARADDPR